MVDTVLAEALERLARDTPPSPQLQHLNPVSAKAALVRNHHVDQAAIAVEALAALLNADSLFESWRIGNVRTSPHAAASFRLTDLAQWALAQAHMRPAQEVMAHLAHFVATNAAPMIEALVLWGLHPDRPIDLGDGLRLVALDSLPQTQPQDRFFGVRDVLHTEGDGFVVPRPRAAIVYDFVHAPVLAPIGHACDWHVQDAMRDAVCILPIAVRSPVSEVAHWFQCDINTPLIGGARSWSGGSLVRAFSREIAKQEYASFDIRSVVTRFRTLPHALRDILRISTSYLNDAMLAGDNATKAINLGIALEAVLTTDGEGTEISYRVRQRAAAIVEGAAKRSTYERIKALYNLRSKAVHGSTLKDEITYQQTRVRTRDFLRDSEQLVADILRCILDRGALPDWDALILGW